MRFVVFNDLRQTGDPGHSGYPLFGGKYRQRSTA